MCTQKVGRLAKVSLLTNSKSKRKNGWPLLRVTVRRSVRLERRLEMIPLLSAPIQPVMSVSKTTCPSSGPLLVTL